MQFATEGTVTSCVHYYYSLIRDYLWLINAAARIYVRIIHYDCGGISYKIIIIQGQFSINWEKLISFHNTDKGISYDISLPNCEMIVTRIITYEDIPIKIVFFDLNLYSLLIQIVRSLFATSLREFSSNYLW